MGKTYNVHVNDNQEFDIEPQEVSSLNLIKTSHKNYHILQENKSFKAEVLEGDLNTKQYVVKINGSTYQVKILDDLDLLINNMGFSNAVSHHTNTVVAPMPGLILDIFVEVGQQVEENSSLLILEAMKMENNILSPRSGTIKSIEVKKGEAVEKSHLLIEFE
ncbi:acetyl-CoA carboxylase biotin carboxyl carrier protein subunit [Tamlana sp. s12]|uniref:acetyl-CoA carboxylase biotin carboxyl carrier protein subunit n=1 Tax=Tamlana sp. s12 TaxID=1630406 RepID=UPI0008005D0B|nr:acetyl-CoA carboxylase biotin carboxyl carrier protein subunit [Tamlana sp. s12]OBQ52771.1 acetyl-COA carboxylase [Tamlana sp. s12]QQY81208.1 acetyl-CoA carboxylase biotin carboxyl carrier protein subunit [Tamlana sp. s12]